MTCHWPEPIRRRRGVELAIGGMTCASCAARIEKKLNRLDGVSATVNFATERRTSRSRPRVDRERPDRDGRGDRLHRRAARPPPRGGRDPEPARDGAEDSRPAPAAAGRPLALTVPVLVLAMVPALQFRGWQWLSLALAAPVVIWGAWPFHRAALGQPRHGAATMDTLISLGVLAAYVWSLYALFFGGAGEPGMTG